MKEKKKPRTKLIKVRVPGYCKSEACQGMIRYGEHAVSHHFQSGKGKSWRTVRFHPPCWERETGQPLSKLSGYHGYQAILLDEDRDHQS